MSLFTERAALPMLIAHRQEPFDHPNWIYELKLDGFRCLCYLDKDMDEFRNKRNLDIGWRFPELKGIHNYVTDRCILDGEVVIMKAGLPDFYEVQRRTIMTDKFKIAMAEKMYPAAFVAYDCIYWKNQSLIDFPLMKRKEILNEIVQSETERFAISKYFEGKGCALYQICEEQKLEGVVAKRKDSLYHMGVKSKDWIKFKRMEDEDFVVSGYIQKGTHTYSFIIAKYRNGQLIYRGHVTSGVTREAISHLSPIGHSPIPIYPSGSGNDEAVWVQPNMVCTVEYIPNTKDSLRQPVFKGFRYDVLPDDCVMD